MLMGSLGIKSWKLFQKKERCQGFFLVKCPMHQRERVHPLLGLVVFLLPILLAWGFLPQASDSFSIKNHVATAGVLLLSMILLIRKRQEEIVVAWGMFGGAAAFLK